MGRFIDLTNQRFGKLLVKKNVGKLDKKGYYWECQCDCGKTAIILGSALRSGNTKSCGCGKYDGLKQYNLYQSELNKIPINSKFGKLTVIEDLGFRPQTEKHNRRWYKCICECGAIKEVQGNSLKQGQVKSCGKCLSSNGEYQISCILEELNVSFDKEFVHPLLLQETGRRLRFDFVVYNEDKTIKCLIEFDGRQHYMGPDTTYWGRTTDSLDTIKEKDSIKNKFCLNHNIPLFRIPYWITPTKENIFSEKFLYKGADES